MNKELFRKELLDEINDNIKTLMTNDKEWTVKGFIDIFKNIYTISVDTKVISKILELMLFPIILTYCKKNNIKPVIASAQNHYPDLTFILPDGEKFAMDIKSAYRINNERISGFTLGAFTGYFRNRTSIKNSTCPYANYSKHFVLGVIYSRKNNNIEESKTYNLDDIESISSVISDLEIVLQEKFKIAHYTPGSGNTKNIGSIKDINRIRNGSGPFAILGERIFDDYWMYYQTADMATDGKPPYLNLEEYVKYKQLGSNINIDITKDWEVDE